MKAACAGNCSARGDRKAWQKTASDGKARKRLQFCALPLELTRQGVALCPWVTSKSQNWSSFMKSKTPDFGGTRPFTALVGFRHLCFGAGEQGQSGLA